MNILGEAPSSRSREAAAPTLSIEGFEGPLDWLVEWARARRFDLRRVSVLALIEAFEAALQQALAGSISPATLARWGDWLVLAAELTLLRSRLMLRAETQTANAQAEAQALRLRLIGRAEMTAAAAWLQQRTQLGTDVFERGAPETAHAAGQRRAGDITALLRACLVALTVPDEAAAAAIRIITPDWTVADALARMRRLLAEAKASNVALQTFLPAVALTALDRPRQCRAAVASTLVAALELARQGTLTLIQTTNMGPITVNTDSKDAATTPSQLR